MTLLDSTVLIDFLRGVEHVRDRLLGRPGVFLTSAVVVDQVLYGVRHGEGMATHRLIQGLDVVPVGRDEAILAARWRREFAREGVTLDQSDCLIAASAVTHGVPLATANVKDFPMREVTVEHWPHGPDG
jgi:predicted nucleic acid-binding protein